MKSIATVFFFCLIVSCSFAQNSADTLIYAEGKILNGTTKEAVSATISYQSLPYGNKVGLLTGSSYRFPLFDNERYEIMVEAPGFAPAKYMLDPAEAKERLVVKDVELGLPTTASKAAETTHTVGKVLNLDNLIFQLGKAKIESASFEELDQVVKMLQTYPKMIIQLEGHTDVKGDAKQNMRLSQERVDAVKEYLVSKGVTKNKVKTKAFGGTQPLSRADTEEAHKMNRRVQVRILEN
ncbi:MAG TPA: OmpA family protein [Cyclobacteriaceae bacterium]|nr:OmpA family protein [Cyclobacteriaceae bacterium]